MDSIDDLLAAMSSSTHETYDVILIDGNGVTHPAHAMVPPAPGPARAKEVSTLVWSKLDPVLERYSAARVVLTWDGADNRASRRALHPCYKFGRAAKDPELRAAMHAVYRTAKLRGYAQPVERDYEADDVIASLVRQLRAQNQRVLIISEDRDLHQLVCGTVHQLHPRDGALCDPVTVDIRGQHAATAHTHRKALRGDAGDNIRGLPGVGEKVADAALMEYPELVRDCLHGKVQWRRLSEATLKALARSGASMCHPARAPKCDKRECGDVAALKAVQETIRETYWLVSLEDGLDIPLSEEQRT